MWVLIRPGFVDTGFVDRRNSGFVDRRNWHFGKNRTTLRFKDEFTLAAIDNNLFSGPSL
jgi:hypothetical protein